MGENERIPVFRNQEVGIVLLQELTESQEHFARIAPKDSMKRKQFLKGIEQLSLEGAVQLYKQPDIGTETYIVGVVGVLQLEVLEHRLKSEYNVDISLHALHYRQARWIRFSAESRDKDPKSLTITSTSLVVMDHDNTPVILFESEWAIQWAIDRNRGLALEEIHDHESD